MKKTAIILILITIVLISEINGQNLFPEKFEGCNTDVFALESDTTIAKIEDGKLIEIISKSLDEKSLKKIKGTLFLQIIVELNGNSCLISLQNETNIKSKKINLKENIDNDLKWGKPEKKVAVIVVFYFKDSGIEIKRLGMNGKKGIHELIDE